MPAKWSQEDERTYTAYRTILKKLEKVGEEPQQWLVDEYAELTARKKAAKPRRPKGEGGVYQRADGMWCVSLELPSTDGKRRRKVICRKSKDSAAAELEKLKAEQEAKQEPPTRTPAWRGSSRRVGR